MSKQVTVTSAQVMAARIRLLRLQERGEVIPTSLRKVAHARHRGGKPLRIGILELDEPFLTTEELAATQPELNSTILDAIVAVVHALEHH